MLFGFSSRDGCSISVGMFSFSRWWLVVVLLVRKVMFGCVLVFSVEICRIFVLWVVVRLKSVCVLLFWM